MNNQREPFWWPMTAPPLPNREDDYDNGWPWVQVSHTGISFIRTDPAADGESLSMAGGGSITE